METILDHKPTDQELEAVYGSVADARTLLSHGMSRDSALAGIASLMALRGEAAASERYISLISNPEYRANIAYVLSDTIE